MFQNSKITPRWGKNIYNLWGCESLEYQDPEKESIVRSAAARPKGVPIKKFLKIRKFNKIVCMDCKHFISQQCPLSHLEIQEAAKKYIVLKLKCENCIIPLKITNFYIYSITNVFGSKWIIF